MLDHRKHSPSILCDNHLVGEGPKLVPQPRILELHARLGLRGHLRAQGRGHVCQEVAGDSHAEAHGCCWLVAIEVCCQLLSWWDWERLEMVLSLHIIPSCHSCHSDLQLYIWRCLLWDNPGSTEESRQSPPPHQPAAGPGRAQVRGRDSGLRTDSGYRGWGIQGLRLRQGDRKWPEQDAIRWDKQEKCWHHVLSASSSAALLSVLSGESF